MTAATSSRSRWPGICSDLQPADAAPSRPVVDGREDRPSTTNKKAYSHRKPPDTPEIGFVGMDCGRTLQAAGVCRNNATVVDNTMRDSTKRASEAREREQYSSTYVRTTVCINNTYVQTYLSGRNSPDFGGIGNREIGMHSSGGVCTPPSRGWS